jgi:hypothetical protein
MFGHSDKVILQFEHNLTGPNRQRFLCGLALISCWTRSTCREQKGRPSCCSSMKAFIHMSVQTSWSHGSGHTHGVRSYLNAVFKTRSCHVHTPYLLVGWCRELLLQNSMAVPQPRSLMCLSSLHHLITSDAAIESPGMLSII